FFSSRRRHTRCYRDWSSDVCSSDLTSRDHRSTPGRRGSGGTGGGAGKERWGRSLTGSGYWPAALVFNHPIVLVEDGVMLIRIRKIGRASCRERVYMWGGQ